MAELGGCVYLFHVICNIIAPVRLMVKPDTHNPPAALCSYARHPYRCLVGVARGKISRRPYIA